MTSLSRAGCQDQAPVTGHCQGRLLGSHQRRRLLRDLDPRREDTGGVANQGQARQDPALPTPHWVICAPVPWQRPLLPTAPHSQ